jgi:hypothetical protein
LAARVPDGGDTAGGADSLEPAPAAASPAQDGAGAGDELVDAALLALTRRRHALTAADPQLPAEAGLYAIYGAAAVWEELGLGQPLDERPLYVGKAEDSLVSRDLRTHFGDGRTGSSTVRRSFAALLHERLGLEGRPRSPAKPERFSNYGLTGAHDAALTRWMRERLQLAVWPKPRECRSLAMVELAVLERWKPPLNLKDVRTPWSAMVSAARAVMAEEARRWAASQ